LRWLVGLEEKREKNKINPYSMHLFDKCMYSPTSASNKNKLVPKGKLVKPSENKSNFDFLLLLSNAPTRPRSCQSITLIYFHHPPIILKLLPFSLLAVLENYSMLYFTTGYKNI